MARDYCDKAPNGRHCYHMPAGLYAQGQAMLCCWCGQSNLDEHGLYHPNKARPDRLTVTWSEKL